MRKLTDLQIRRAGAIAGGIAALMVYIILPQMGKAHTIALLYVVWFLTWFGVIGAAATMRDMEREKAQRSREQYELSNIEVLMMHEGDGVEKVEWRER